jgi:hypothetical protein
LEKDGWWKLSCFVWIASHTPRDGTYILQEYWHSQQVLNVKLTEILTNTSSNSFSHSSIRWAFFGAFLTSLLTWSTFEQFLIQEVSTSTHNMHWYHKRMLYGSTRWAACSCMSLW